ncbi:MAG TPA: pyridoxal-phosphate dependent enzyme [Pilimelia sp.]|nr:pyridoxal-phosphate dependent enzyme [Pilimelia sp.]
MTPRPRRSLAALPTPLQRLTGLEAQLRGGPLYLKRDDLTGFGLAGNKARALEFLVGDALAQRADMLVAAGSPGSNFIAAAAMAAQVCGLDCDVLVAGPHPASPPATLRLAEIAGARLYLTGADREDLDELVDKHATRLRGEGRSPYGMPRGGASHIGALGFAYAAEEVSAQLAAAGVEDAVVVLPTGSGASLAGLLAGRAAIGARWRVHGVSVSRPLARIRADVLGLARSCAAGLRSPAPAEGDLVVVDARGDGFGRVTERDRRDALMALRSGGLLLDPTYGTKAFGAMLGLVAAGERSPIVLWHTGGLPSALSLLAAAGSP